MKPYYEDSSVQIYHGDCREIVPDLPPSDLTLSDPPYPNNAGHFDSAVDSARDFLRTYECQHWMIFWDEMERPPVPLPLVAIHIWHRNNSNRPDNYEPIYEFHIDNIKRPSRVLPYCVIAVGMTGLPEAALGHPTQKNVKLLQRLIHLSEAQTILDPFMGVGTTLRAAKDIGRKSIGIEIEERYCEISARRMAQEVFQFA
jgi:site-specific DNA-methyltransferase (adenine-specific)